MAGIKISELVELSGAQASDSDVLVIVDVSTDQTKKITFENLIASNIDSASRSSSALISTVANNINTTNNDVNTDMFILFTETAEGGDSVYTSSALTYNPSTSTLTANLSGTADSAVFAQSAGVADSANFSTNSLNDVIDNYVGLVTGQVLKWDGSQWANANDNTGDVGAGVVAKQINTVSETTDASFLIPFVGAVGTDSVGVDGQLTYNPNTDTLSVTNITATVSQATDATLAATAVDARNLIVDSVAASGTYYPIMRLDRDPGADSANMSSNFSWEVSTNTLSATNFNGNGSNISNVAAVSATNATNVAINQESTTATFYMHFGSALSGNDGVDVDGDLRVNPGLHTLSYNQNTARFTLGADSDFSIDAGGTRYSFNVVNNGSSAYTFGDTASVFFPSDSDNPVLYLRRGDTYRFDVNASGHPFQIRLSDGGSAYNTGVTNNGAEVGSVLFAVSMNAPSTLYYQCTVHSGMGNTINIV
tara:strand:+ start:7845 stop:9284 length:1440 start_codon:yes stop_codon:yes gene_type:complete